MEGQGGSFDVLKQYLKKLRGRFSKNKENSSLVQRSSISPLTQEERDAFFNRVQQMMKDGNVPELTMQVNYQGGIDSRQTAELRSAQPHIRLADAAAGDVIGWTTTSGSQYLYRIEEQYSLEDHKVGKGSLRRIKLGEGGRESVQDFQNVVINGASNQGSMLRLGYIALNTGVDLSFPRSNPEDGMKGMNTTPVTNMNILPNKTIQLRNR